MFFLVSGMTTCCPTSWPSAMTAENGPPSMMDTLTGWVSFLRHHVWCHVSLLFPWLSSCLLSSCSLETMIRTLRWWTSWQSLCWPATSESSLRAGTALCVWGWRSWAARCLVSLEHTYTCTRTNERKTSNTFCSFSFPRSSSCPVQAKWSDSSRLLGVQTSQLLRNGCSEYPHMRPPACLIEFHRKSSVIFPKSKTK